MGDLVMRDETPTGIRINNQKLPAKKTGGIVKKMMIINRILTAIASLTLIAAIYLPIWRIDLTAPQYPEGLYMNIWADKLGGDVDIINGLNHYIGMKTLHANEFVEFTVLPYIIWALVGLGLVAAVLNKRKIFFAYYALFLLFAVAAMVDFYRWEYNYGHNLNPEAPIQVPGMAYQPPLLGYKQLLNFSAYSIPDKGGWFFISGGIIFTLAAVLEWLRMRKEKKRAKTIPLAAPAAMAAMVLLMLGCTSGPDTIRFGKDACDHCRMTIMDKKFGGEIVTGKGKTFRFDDARCLVDFLNSGSFDKKSPYSAYFLDYNGSGNFIAADSAFLVQSSALHSPMGGNIAAFKDAAAGQKIIDQLSGSQITWEELKK